MTACDDPPTCALRATFSEGLTGEARWNRTGAENCGLASIEAFDQLVIFIRNDGAEGPEGMFITLEGGSLSVGTHEASLDFFTPLGLWSTSRAACTAEIVEVTAEDWTLIDFVSFRGTLDCPDPLISALGDPVEIDGVVFGGHVYNEFSELPAI